MLMSAIEGIRAVPSYPELAGRRVLITGLSPELGVDIARAFAEHKARLVLQVPRACAKMQAVAEMLSSSALDLRLFDGPLPAGDALVAFARAAATAFGGLDAVVNLIPLGQGRLAADASLDDIETEVANRLLLPTVVSKIVVNRMRLTHTEGVVLNVAALPPGAGAVDRAVATVTKSALVTMTRNDAREWASEAIRFNAIAPQVAAPSEPGLAGETDMAALALYLTSGRGKALSGHVFEADAGRGL